MTPERRKRIEELYREARAKAPGDRAAFLAEACANDEAMQRDVASLLAESHPEDRFLAGLARPMPTETVTNFVPATLTGVSLGGYRLQALLGVGGMGEVYRARDAKLGRDVAIKILPTAFTTDPDRLARFAREARMLAALNHPNICAIYGFEEADGVRFLILELVEGDTLAHAFAHGSSLHAKADGLPLGQVFAVARQIADALEVAHDKGIVHRDLKPANIKITPDGVVKVLDFGIAKAVGGGDGRTERPHGSEDGGTREGAVIGTAAYMSPEQARGLPIDKRTDIWAFGCVLYEMLTGRVAFAGDTSSDSIAKILEREPDWSALPAATPASIRRVLLRCLTKDPKKRLRDVGDVRIEIDAIDELLPGTPEVTRGASAPAKTRTRWLPWVAIVALAAAIGTWEARRPLPVENPLPSENFRSLTDWPGNEGHAEISPDGKVVAFLADRDGEVDLFSGQVATEEFTNLTRNIAPLDPVAIQRRLGFSPDSARLWFGPRSQKMEMPWSGGVPRALLEDGAQTLAWSSDDRLVFFDQFHDDAMMLADGAGRNAREIPIDWPAADAAPHNHNMVWSPDNQWIYFVHGAVRDFNQQTYEMDIWRVHPEGGSPERLTFLNISMTFLAMLDQDTLVFIAPEEDGFGSWLWSLDVGRLRTSGAWWGVDRVTPRRIPTGTEQYTSVSASRNRGPVVATKAKPSATLWSVPVFRDRPADEDEVIPLRVGTERALAPRYARRATSPVLFYLSARGTGDRLWGFTTTSFEITKGVEGHLSETPAPSPDGSRVVIVVKEGEERHLSVMNQDGQGSQTLATSIDIEGATDWSPDGGWIAAGGREGGEPGLFVIPADGGRPRRLAPGQATDPVWSPSGDFMVYSGPFSGGSPTSRAGSPLKAVRPDGKPYDLALVGGQTGKQEDLRVSPGGYRFLDETHLVYRPAPESLDFSLFDLVTGERRPLTHLRSKGSLRGFDITPDGKHIVFDRTLQNSDVVLITLPNK